MEILGKKIKIIGHRGVAALEPENTLLGYERALKLGCDTIEVDAQISKDQEIVLIHDQTLGRTTSGSGLVSNKTLDELKKLDAGKKEKIPTLKETWDLIKNKAELNIDIKDKKTLKQILLFIEKENIKDQIIISSKSYWSLYKIKRSNPSLRIGLISSSPFFLAWQAKNINAESIHPIFFATNKILVERAHKKNLKVYPFPYGTKKENIKNIKNLISMGVDGIFLNDPTILNKL